MRDCCGPPKLAERPRALSRTLDAHEKRKRLGGHVQRIGNGQEGCAQGGSCPTIYDLPHYVHRTTVKASCRTTRWLMKREREQSREGET
jgi:hypothetical protein